MSCSLDFYHQADHALFCDHHNPLHIRYYIYWYCLSFTLVILGSYITIQTQGSPVPPLLFPSPTSPQAAVAPQFLSVHQLVEVSVGSSALLNCRLTKLEPQHTVGTHILVPFCIIGFSKGLLDEILRHVSFNCWRSCV